MVNGIKTYSFKGDKIAIIDEFVRIAEREGRGESEIIVSLIEDYVKNHGNGNPSFKLDNWNEDPSFTAIPTIHSKPEVWYKYLQECNKQDRLDIQIKTNHINQQCKAIKEE